ncbi:gluconokinase [Lactobacillus hamsteri DSM 5661 = JCM 6256]|uniref:Gluconokinase n=1 Tax=Lactobacillus hamsteri DSM 5661 = JCM 6256 TaxID=1423754 RepID=A0A0R1YF31_9LACO|nr:gluconokinase [Lactobacillus hamsteri DSM 5661 = JCM 6256]
MGTTASKGVLYDENGKQIFEIGVPYPLIQTKVGQAEEDPEVIFDAVQQIIYKLSKNADGKIMAISWSSQMHSLIGLDENKNLLTNSITWADNRAEEIVAGAKESGLGKIIYQNTGMPIHPMAPVYKLMWLKEKNAQLYKQVKYWIGIKEYLIYRLTGELWMDIPMAAGSGMLDLKTLTWDNQILNKLELSIDQLPKLTKPTEIISNLSDEYRRKLNLSSNTLIVIGASDGYLSTIGVGVLSKSDFALNVGTSGAVRTLVTQPIIDKKARYFCYPADKKSYLVGGPVNNGGIAFEWARKTIFDADETAEDFLNIAQSVPAGSGGLIFHPYLGGERAPIWNANSKASFIGLTRNHTKPQMARSVLEGIVFNLFEASHAITENIGRPRAIKVTGGFIRSEFVRQMLANVFNIPMVAMKNSQSGTLAAMFLARLALGMNKELSEINNFITEEKVYFPDSKEVKIYQEIIPIYQEIEHEINQSYEKITAFQNRHPDLFKA